MLRNRHVLYDVWLADGSALERAEPMKALLEAAAQAGGATILTAYFHPFAPCGVTGFLLLAESHLSVHTWPEECFAAFDVFSCGDMDTARIVEVIREALHPIREDVRILHRGVDEDVGMDELAPGAVATPPRLIKCVVWDLDDTLWTGVQAEGAPPQPRPAVLAVIDALAARGIVHSVASRNDPATGTRLLESPDLAGRFVAPQVGWEPKDKALRQIAATLNIGLDSLAFVDDSPFERAAVAHLLPQVLVLAPEDVPGLPDRPEFAHGPVTAEAVRRTALYQEEADRQAAEQAWAGSRLDFLRACDMRLTIAPATEADLPRLNEMVARTNQLNSTGVRYSPAAVAARVHDPARYRVPTARLTDRFGDYGLIGAALVDRLGGTDGGPLVELLMLSCRVEGRGIPAALLRHLLATTQAEGHPALDALYRPTPQNRQMVVLLRSIGFRAADPLVSPDPLLDGARIFRRPISGDLPPTPEWLQIEVHP